MVVEECHAKKKKLLGGAQTSRGRPEDRQATIQVVSSTTNPGLDCRFGEMRDLRDTPPVVERINDRFSAAQPLKQTKAGALPVKD